MEGKGRETKIERGDYGKATSKAAVELRGGPKVTMYTHDR